MRNKTPLTLIEQTVMILVFALCAALCLQAFAGADARSRENALRDRAVILAESAAETLKATRGDAEAACALSADGLTVDVQEKETEAPFLGQATVNILDENGGIVFSLPAAWQEVRGHG